MFVAHSRSFKNNVLFTTVRGKLSRIFLTWTLPASEWNKLDATVVALTGVGIMIPGVIKRDDVLAGKGAWDAGFGLGGPGHVATSAGIAHYDTVPQGSRPPM